MQVSRRELFRYAAVGSAALGAAALGATAVGATASAAPLGTLVDYSGGVPSAEAIRAAGHVGAIRYVSDRRPGAEWMLGKPIRADEASALTAAGLEVVSCYQFGKGATADWRGGFAAGVDHANRGLELHRAAGGPEGRPIYTSIDDNPSGVDIVAKVLPYVLGWESVIGHENTGVYANSGTIDALRAVGAGSFFWQHDWGTPDGYVHPAAHLHQFEIDKRSIDGIGIDRNTILKADYGQWSLA
ncbi:DUF1906 domain-containing protein [Rhodococcus gannanensis]|uniref:DUF1906 domain-containing protein n=1 Tax=Rhodococcus gannanensis TaxID=1960308 RepID=A0ABW4NZ65_9NOCA